MDKLINLIAAAAIVAILCVISSGCISPIGVTIRPFTIEIEAPKNNAH